MATDESQQIKGWRSRMEDQAAELRRRMWQAPAQVVYLEGKSPPPNGEPGGHERWFHREFGAERALARAALQAFRETQAEIERSEETEDQREARNAHLRNWRKRQTDQWREAQAMQKRARRAANPELYRAIDQRHELRRRDERNAQRRAAYAEAPEAHRAKLNARRAAQRERERERTALAAAAHAPDDPGQKPG